MAETVLCALPDRARFVLHADAPALPAVGAAFGVVPPCVPLTSAVVGDRAALWLGPGEWLLLAPPGTAPPAVPDAWVVDVSHRQLGLVLAGPGATLVLNEGCPLDLDPAAFPPGLACTRTLFGKVEILLWRRGADSFEIEVARSYATALRRLLEAALADLG